MKIRRKFDKKAYKDAKRHLDLVYNSLNMAEALIHWQNFLKTVEKHSKDLSSYYEKKTKNYLAFIDYPIELRKYLYTTNAVENINSGIKVMRYDLGGYFQSVRALEVNLFLQFVNLNDKWMRQVCHDNKSATI